MIFADVSEFQTVDWPTYGPKYGAVIVRAHNGWRADYKIKENLAGARRYCQWRGWYQYLPRSVDPATAAKGFAAVVGPLQPGEVMILDLEEGDGDQRARRQAWYDAMPAGVAKWTYSGLWYSGAHLPGVPLDWVAAYQNTEPTVPHVLWQKSSTGTFAGIPGHVDTNQFNGTLAQLRAITEAPVTLTSAEIEAVADRVWANDRVPAPWSSDPNNTTWTPENVLSAIGQWALAGRNAAQRAVDIVTENQRRIGVLSSDVADLRATVATQNGQVVAAVQAVLDAVRAVAPAVNLSDDQLAKIVDAAKTGAASALSVDSAAVTLNVSPGGTPNA